MPVNAAAIAYCVGGTLVLFSGIKGATIADTVSAVLSGNLSVQNTEPITVTNSATPGNSVTPIGSPSSIVSDALTYNHDNYVFGGIPGTAKGHNNGTDCSGFVNMIVGRDLGLPIPGYPAGKYDGSSHGPVTQVWLLWDGAKTIPLTDCQPGDLACFQTHMGIFVDSGQHFISALDTKDGVLVTTIAGGSPSGEKLYVRRLLNA